MQKKETTVEDRHSKPHYRSIRHVGKKVYCPTAILDNWVEGTVIKLAKTGSVMVALNSVENSWGGQHKSWYHPYQLRLDNPNASSRGI